MSGWVFGAAPELGPSCGEAGYEKRYSDNVLVFDGTDQFVAYLQVRESGERMWFAVQQQGTCYEVQGVQAWQHLPAAPR